MPVHLCSVRVYTLRRINGGPSKICVDVRATLKLYTLKCMVGNGVVSGGNRGWEVEENSLNSHILNLSTTCVGLNRVSYIKVQIQINLYSQNPDKSVFTQNIYTV